MRTVEEEAFPDQETPTHREPTSGKWMVAVDRGAKIIEDAIAQLEAGGEVDHVIEQLRVAHGLVNGRLAR